MTLWKKRSLSVLLLLTLFLPILSLAGCSADTSPVSQNGFYFDTIIQITVYSVKDASCLDGCFALAETYENMLSATVEGSDVWRINHSKGEPVTVSDDTISLLTTALTYAELSGGKIDPTIEPVSALWDFHTEDEPSVPSDTAIKEALSHVDYTAVTITGNTVTLEDPEAAIDLGFIAKGYIADRIKDYLVSNQVKSALINLGGNILVLGSKPDGSAYHIGIQEPFAEDGSAITTVSVRDKSLVSSGVYERYFYQDGVLYHHILDTSTGYPLNNNIAGVTILSDSSVVGDALSTTCYCLGLEAGMNLIESLDQVEALFITMDNELYYSSGFTQ